MDNERANRVIVIVEQYLLVDGYFARKEEMAVRGVLLTNEPDWLKHLCAELKSFQLDARAKQSGTSVHLSVFPLREGIPWVNIILFLLTLASVSFIPAYVMEGDDVFKDIDVLLRWQRFAIPLISILLFHEFGHYLAARRRGIRVSLPYFLPAPNIFGTFGAFIKSKEPFPNRRDLLEVGAYGPIAGFVIAIIFMAIGLSDINYRLVPAAAETAHLIEPVIMRILMFFFQSAPGPEGYDIFLQDNPMLFAAWVGIVVTMINLLPVGQLDGGHIVYAMFPRAHRNISIFIFLLLVACGFIWQGWWLWAFLIFFIVRFGHPPTLNDRKPLEPGARRIGWLAILIFLLTFTPIPF